MILRTFLAIAAFVALDTASAFAQEDKPRVRCGDQYMTVVATGGANFVNAGPLTFRKSDVRAIYVASDEKLTMWIEIGKVFLNPTIKPADLRPMLECLD